MVTVSEAPLWRIGSNCYAATTHASGWQYTRRLNVENASKQLEKLIIYGTGEDLELRIHFFKLNKNFKLPESCLLTTEKKN